MSSIKKDDNGVIHVVTPESETIIDTENGTYAHMDYAVDNCKDGKPHEWDGPEVTTYWGTGASCSKCGLDYGTYAIRCLP